MVYPKEIKGLTVRLRSIMPERCRNYIQNAYG